MGIYTERLREMIKTIPMRELHHMKPELFSGAMTQLVNASLQVIGNLEEALASMEKENASLAERMIEAGIVDEWKPTEGA